MSLLSERTSYLVKRNTGTSLVVQWLRIHLPVQVTWVQSLVPEYAHMLRNN